MATIRRYSTDRDADSQYRRGTIMGLTVAEAFMLVAFVLLTLLLLWRQVLEQRLERVSNLSENDIIALQEGAVTIQPDELEEMKLRLELTQEVPKEKLEALAAGETTITPDRLTNLERRAARAEGLPDNALNALREGAVTIQPDELEEMKLRLELTQEVPKEKLEALAAGETTITPDRLTNLERRAARAEGLPDNALNALREGAVTIPPDELAELKEARVLRQELDPSGEHSIEELLDIIKRLQSQQTVVEAKIAEDAATRRKFIETLKLELALDVEKAGGKFDALGRIVFPETVVFESGSSTIPWAFRTILDDICERWLEVLKESASKIEIDEIRIEGHSSPEWATALTQRDAWIENLGLSQRRAQAVLVHCLDRAAGSPLDEWAQSKLTAVGYSSSRPISAPDGDEDWGASRRVVLGHQFSRDELISSLSGLTENEDVRN